MLAAAGFASSRLSTFDLGCDSGCTPAAPGSLVVEVVKRRVRNAISRRVLIIAGEVSTRPKMFLAEDGLARPCGLTVVFHVFSDGDTKQTPQVSEAIMEIHVAKTIASFRSICVDRAVIPRRRVESSC